MEINKLNYKIMIVIIHLNEQSQPVSHKDVKNAYTKGGMYCVLLKGDIVNKYPLVNIFRVIESY